MQINDGKVVLCRSVFGKWKNPKTKNCEIVEKFTWRTANRLEVSVMTLGATLLEIKAPDRGGKVEDILMGFNSLEDYLRDGKHYFGSTVGPVAGVIKNGEFCLNGKIHRINYENKHCLNSGNEGFSKANWTPFVDGNGTDLILSFVTDSSGRFPGVVLVQVLISVKVNNSLIIKTTARSSQVTPIDISTQLYFNLASHNAGINEMMEHLVTINASKVCQKNSDGSFKKTSSEVLNTTFDLKSFKEVEEICASLDGSIDGLFIIDKHLSEETSTDNLQFASRILHPCSGRVLEIQTNQPTVQFSTCTGFPITEEREKKSIHDMNEEPHVDGSLEELTLEHLRTKLTEKEIEFFKCRVDTDSMKLSTKKSRSENFFQECREIQAEVDVQETSEPIKGKGNSSYVKNSGFSVSCHNFPNAVNHQRRYPEILLKPGQVYENNLMLKFGIHVSRILLRWSSDYSSDSEYSDVHYFPMEN